MTQKVPGFLLIEIMIACALITVMSLIFFKFLIITRERLLAATDSLQVLVYANQAYEAVVQKNVLFFQQEKNGYTISVTPAIWHPFEHMPDQRSVAINVTSPARAKMGTYSFISAVFLPKE